MGMSQTAYNNARYEITKAYYDANIGNPNFYKTQYYHITRYWIRPH